MDRKASGACGAEGRCICSRPGDGGAYVLFPYSDEEKYKEHDFYKSIGTVNIGGLSFLPSATNMVREFLEELISDTAESAFERATL